MTQVPLFLALHVVGLAIAIAWGPRSRPGLCCALGFPIGLASTVIMVLALLVVGLPYDRWTFVGSATLLAVAVIPLAFRRRLARGTAPLVIGWTLSFAVVAAALSSGSFVLMSYDSHEFLMLGRVIAADGALAAGTIVELQAWGVFQAIAQSLFLATSEDYLFALQPLLAASFLPLFALSLWDGVTALGANGRHAKLLVALVTTALFTTYMFQRHFLYIHTNLASAIYLTSFALLFWLAEVHRDPSVVPVALLCLLAFSLQRVEAPVFALMFLVLTVVPSTLPRRAIVPSLTLFTMIVAGWYEVLARHAPADGEFLTPTRCRSFGAGVVTFYIYYLVAEWPPLRRLGRWLPEGVALLCTLGLAASFALEPEHMWASAQAWATNLLFLPYWRQTWYAIAALVMLGLAIEAPPHRRVFTYGVTLSFVLILLLAIGRQPYLLSVGDSANRMTLHPLPLLFAYVGLKLIPALTRPTGAAPGGAARESASAEVRSPRFE
jgi:hypothetical protein